MSKLFTRKGDDGYTGLLGGGRVPKYHPRPATVGAIDEATATLGLARANCQSIESQKILLQVQRDLYHLMAEIAALPENAYNYRVIDSNRVEWLEATTNRISSKINMPDEFIIPGDSISGAFIAQARTVIRRAERQVAQLFHSQEIENRELLRYLNRLSSLCFVLEILENQVSGKNTPTFAKGE